MKHIKEKINKVMLLPIMAAIMLSTILPIAGCQTKSQTGALAGAGVGALAGQAIGRDTKATVMGTAIGAGAGYIIGKQGEKKD